MNNHYERELLSAFRLQFVGLMQGQKFTKEQAELLIQYLRGSAYELYWEDATQTIYRLDVNEENRDCCTYSLDEIIDFATQTNEELLAAMDEDDPQLLAHDAMIKEILDIHWNPRFTVEFGIPAYRVDQINRYLSGKGRMAEDEVIAFPVSFVDGKTAEVRCFADSKENGDAFVEVGLFDENGLEICFTEPERRLEGMWTMRGEKNKLYVINISAHN